MQGKTKALLRLLEPEIDKLISKGQSALVFGPRQVGKTTLVRKCLRKQSGALEFLLQNPEVRMDLERDPSLLIRQIEAHKERPFVFIDEAQKIPDIFDSIQYLIDEKNASFLITGSSARKLKKKGTNLLPGRVKSFRLDPLSWNEFGWVKRNSFNAFNIGNINKHVNYTFEKSLIYGSLPGIALLESDGDRKDFLNAYSHIYLEEEIRAEALTRKIGAFSRFLELAANESGTSPNFTKLSLESGVSIPTIKQFYSLLEDTLVVERLDPYLKNARKRILSSPRYYFFDIGVRNALSKMSLSENLINSQRGILFEHAVVLELVRRIRISGENYKLYFWRTGGGAEVDCILDLGNKVIPIEIKASDKITPSDTRGLSIFMDEYKEASDVGIVVTMKGKPQKLTDRIIAVPWNYL